VEELKAPGKYGVREAAVTGSARTALKASILDRPEKVKRPKFHIILDFFYF
jgi:hypothetical protein